MPPPVVRVTMMVMTLARHKCQLEVGAAGPIG
jgi:hypothetical protein